MIFQNAMLHNISELTYDSQFQDFQIHRIPHQLKNQLHERAAKASRHCCGCEIRFRMVSDQVTIHLRRLPVSKNVLHTGILEIYQGDYQGSYQISPPVITTDSTAVTITRLDRSNINMFAKKAGRTYHPDLTRVLLPYDWGCAIKSIEGDISAPSPGDTPEKKLLVYGSSISHGGNSSTPSGTYAMQLARMLHMDLVNMGLAGSCYMEAPFAQYLADRQDWDSALFELGVNVVESWTMEQFYQAALPFLRTIALKNPNKTLYCTDIYRNHLDYKSGSQTDAFRSCLKNIIKELSLPNIRHIDGLSMLTDIQGLSSDGLHPANEGHRQIAENLFRVMTANGPV